MSTDLKQRSITTLDEGPFVRRLMNDRDWRDFLVGFHGIPGDVGHLLEVPLDGLTGMRQGDVDILLFEPDHPEHAIAIEVKRVKVTGDAFFTGSPNKLNDIRKGIKQANALECLGFRQVYLYIFIVVDSRTQNLGTRSFKGLTPELSSTIDAAISTGELAPRVGLIKFDFTQPRDSFPLREGAYDSSLKRRARCTEQAASVTEWIKNLDNRPNA